MKFSAVQLADWSQTKPSYFLHIFGVEIYSFPYANLMIFI